jgi:hypothetical protein
VTGLDGLDGHHLVLHGLPHHLQDACAELGDLVQDEHAAVGQADLLWARRLPAVDQPGVADGVVRGAERPLAKEGRLWWAPGQAARLGSGPYMCARGRYWMASAR